MEEQLFCCAGEQAVSTSLTLVRSHCNMLLKFVRISERQSAGKGMVFNKRRIFWYLMPPECQKS